MTSPVINYRSPIPRRSKLAIASLVFSIAAFFLGLVSVFVGDLGMALPTPLGLLAIFGPFPEIAVFFISMLALYRIQESPLLTGATCAHLGVLFSLICTALLFIFILLLATRQFVW